MSHMPHLHLPCIFQPSYPQELTNRLWSPSKVGIYVWYISSVVMGMTNDNKRTEKLDSITYKIMIDLPQ